MTFKIGDAAFTREGFPSIITARDEKTARLQLERDAKVTQDAMRHGYINGIDPDVRAQLYEILDGAKETGNPQERAVELQTKLTEIEKDPRNHLLARYLRAEMLHIMNTHGIKPREFTVEESKVR